MAHPDGRVTEVLDGRDRAGGAAADDPEGKLRGDARRIFDAAVRAAEPARLVRGALAGDPINRPDDGRLVLIAVGKAAIPMAEGAAAAFEGRIDEAIVLAPAGGGRRAPEGFTVHRGGHPLPDQESMEGARAVREVVRRAHARDRILLLLSGGGSSLLALPVGDVSLEDLRTVTHQLQRAGADIRDLNAVRKHLEVLKGGGLAREAAPAPVRALVLSDVVGDALDVIASGPVAPDPTTYADAIGALERYGLWDEAPAAVRAHLLYGREGDEPETPEEGDPCFSGVETVIVGNVATAVRGAAREAESLGYPTRVLSTGIEGPAREAGVALARAAKDTERPMCLLQGGETTVAVRGDGRGGRNQELVLAAAVELAGTEGVLVFSAGTDGVDGSTEAAGAMATGRSLPRGREAGLDAADHLDRNDSYTWFETLDDLIVTGPTGTNVMDVMGALLR